MWCLANALHPEFLGEKLTSEEWKTSCVFDAKKFPPCMSSFTNFVGGDVGGSQCELENFISQKLRFFHIFKEGLTFNIWLFV